MSEGQIKFFKEFLIYLQRKLENSECNNNLKAEISLLELQLLEFILNNFPIVLVYCWQHDIINAKFIIDVAFIHRDFLKLFLEQLTNKVNCW